MQNSLMTSFMVLLLVWALSFFEGLHTILLVVVAVQLFLITRSMYNSFSVSGLIRLPFLIIFWLIYVGFAFYFFF